MSIHVSLKKNIASLGFLKITDSLVTMAVLPYLLRVLGAGEWGAIVFVQLIINNLIWIINWGFYHGATSRISAERKNRNKLNLIFSEVWTAQIYITILIFFVLLFVLFSIPWIDNKNLYFFAMGMLLSNLLTPIWYLNGLELIKEVAMIQLLIKILALPFIFLLIKNQNESYLYFLINSSISIFIGIIVLFYIFKKDLAVFKIRKREHVFLILKQDFQLFLNGYWATLNTSIVPAVLGFIGGDIALGYYNLAERARGITITVLHPISHALFPRMCFLYGSNKAEAKKMLQRTGSTILGLAFIMSSGMFIFSDKVIILLGGEAFSDSDSIVKILSISAFLTTASAFIINQILIPSGKYSGYSRTVFYCFVFICISIVPAVKSYGAEGAALITLFSEILSVLILLSAIYNKKFRKWNDHD